MKAAVVEAVVDRVEDGDKEKKKRRSRNRKSKQNSSSPASGLLSDFDSALFLCVLGCHS